MKWIGIAAIASKLGSDGIFGSNSPDRTSKAVFQAVSRSLGPVPGRKYGIGVWIFNGRVTLALKMALGDGQMGNVD